MYNLHLFLQEYYWNNFTTLKHIISHTTLYNIVANNLYTYELTHHQLVSIDFSSHHAKLEARYSQVSVVKLIEWQGNI